MDDITGLYFKYEQECQGIPAVVWNPQYLSFYSNAVSKITAVLIQNIDKDKSSPTEEFKSYFKKLSEQVYAVSLDWETVAMGRVNKIFVHEWFLEHYTIVKHSTAHYMEVLFRYYVRGCVLSLEVFNQVLDNPKVISPYDFLIAMKFFSEGKYI